MNIMVIIIIFWIIILVWLFWDIIRDCTYKINKWFEINLGWFFINGHKLSAWIKHLNKKYGKK